MVMGRNSFAMADDPDSIADHYEYQVPIFVPTHSPPAVKPMETRRLTFTYVTGATYSAIAKAKATTGSRTHLRFPFSWSAGKV